MNNVEPIEKRNERILNKYQLYLKNRWFKREEDK